MAIVIEDGTIVDGANSWIQTTYSDDYITDMGYTGTAALESDLIQAYVFLKYQPWCISHAEAYTVEVEHKNAQAEIAYRIKNGFDIGAPIDSDRVKREKVDEIDTEFFSAGGRSADPYITLKLLPTAYAMIKSFLCWNNSNYLLRA